VHHALADEARGYFAFATGQQFLFDAVDGRFDKVATARAFLQGSQDAGSEFVLAKGFAVAIGLDDAGHGQFGDFESREALLAFHAFAPTAHLIAFLRQTGVYDPGFLCATKGTPHVGFPWVMTA
jgi:hypothetical protein